MRLHPVGSPDESHDDLICGRRVKLRGDVWTIESRTRYADCEVIRLRNVLPATESVRTFLRPFDHVVPISSRDTPRIVSAARWNRGALSAIATARPFGSLGSAAAAHIDVLPYQLEPALAILRHGHTRVLLADEVGLGKTVQTILVFAELARDTDLFRGIVLSPASLVDQWIRELAERFGLAAQRADAIWLATQSRNLPPDVNPWSLPGIFVASIDLVKRPEVLRPLEDVTWDLAAIDEAHGAALATARFAAAHAIARRSRRVILMTATPPDGDVAQFDALLGVGSHDDPIIQFRRSRADVGHPADRRTRIVHLRLSRAERRMQRVLAGYTSALWKEQGAATSVGGVQLAATLLRKRALSSARSLAISASRRLALLTGSAPEREQQLLLPLGEEDAISDDVGDGVLGSPGLSDTARERSLLGRIKNLAVLAAKAESKLGVLLRLLRRVREPAIVFTEYRDTLLHIESAVRAAGHEPVLLHGGMSSAERSAAVRVFNSSAALLLATDAASEGLNLQRRCRLVIHFELPWTVTRLEQRTGRVDRLGQQRRVHEVLLVARDTAERLVLMPLVERARASAARGGHGNRLLALSESLVAARIIAGQTLDAVDRTPHTSQFPSTEAIDEAARVERRRRAAVRGASGQVSEDFLVTAGRAVAPARATLLLEVRLTDARHRTCHSEVVALQMHVAWPGERTRDALRRFARAVIEDGRALLVSLASEITSGSIAAAKRHHDTVSRAIERRDRAILQCLPSAATRLVQPGLFDRRAVKIMERRKRIAALLTDEAEARSHASAATLDTAVEIRVAALRIGSRR